jgi:chromate transporter
MARQLAAFLGAEVPSGLPPAAGAAIAVLAIFVPGGLLLAGVLPAWGRFGRSPRAAAAVAGVNAVVVGLLGAAFYDPVWTQGVKTSGDLVIVLAGFVLLVFARARALFVVLGCVGASLLLSALAG